MKLVSLLLLISSLCVAVHAATPQMWVKTAGNRIPLRIDQIEAEITITGSIAETVLTLRFRNETKRMQEGEFVMPLPKHSTVSQYALEVNGKLRDGVAVEKKQARVAYETIKRQMIDPGLVEREAGNNYRTKVFPIPAEGTKLVRIGYIEHLTRENGQFHYQLPTEYPGIINEFKCSIRHQGKIKITAAGLQFSNNKDNSTSTTAANKKLPKSITITSKEDLSGVFMLENHGQYTYFLCESKAPAGAIEKKRLKPQHINLIWDASQSCANRPLKRELDILDSYFKQLGSAKVTLQLLRNTLQSAGEYQVTSGQWKRLRSVLENTFYDGSTNYQAIAKSQLQANLTLLFTDGLFAQNLSLNTAQNTFIFHTSDTSNINPTSRVGKVETIHTLNTPLKDQLHQLTHTQYKIQPLKLPNLTALALFHHGKITLVGRCTGIPAEFNIIHKNANGDQIKQTFNRNGSLKKEHSSIIQRAWAQEQLRVLETTSGDRQKITAHCREFGLVSDYTSLIVLERFSDYVRFNIPPPEADLRKQWVEARKKKKHKSPSPKELAEGLSNAWQRKVTWYDNSYSWISDALAARGQQTEIWMRAIEQVFNKNDIDLQAYGAIESWHKEAQNTAQEQYQIKTLKAYQAWRKHEEQLVTRWDKLADHPIKKSTTQQLSISVRGLVINPGTYRSKKSLTLKESIALAGGKMTIATLQHVSIYRNSQRITYNLLSDQYQDIPLLPGDMIVVEPVPYDPSDYWDPFSGGEDLKPVDPKKEPAVTQIQPQLSRGSSGGSDPFGGGGSPPKKNDQTVIRIKSPISKAQKKPSMQHFARELETGKDAAKSYHNLKGKNHFGNDFYIHAAKLLHQHGHDTLATQVISNILENLPPSDVRQRTFAYWLAEIGLRDKAREILQNITPTPAYKHTHALDLIRFKAEKDLASAYHAFFTKNSKEPNIQHKVFALTERNAYRKPTNSKLANSLARNFSADIRCVIYSADPSVKINTHIQEPLGNITSRWSPSSQGGKIFTSPGIQEYMLRRAMPGSYTVQCSANEPVTVQIAIYSHWGTPKQTCQWTTVQLDRRSTIAAEYTIDFQN